MTSTNRAEREFLLGLVALDEGRIDDSAHHFSRCTEDLDTLNRIFEWNDEPVMLELLLMRVGLEEQLRAIAPRMLGGAS